MHTNSILKKQYMYCYITDKKHYFQNLSKVKFMVYSKTYLI